MPDQSSPKTFTFTVENPGQTALDVLADGTGLSRQRIKDAMNKGAAWWNQKGKTLRLRRATKVLNKGCKIQLFYDEQVLARKPEPAQLIHDADRYSIWFKPHGMLSQGSQWGDHCSLLRWVEVNGTPKRECFLVHRLDADAAGLVLIAHDQQSAARLSHLFQSRDIRKCYQAWVNGLPPIPTRTKPDCEHCLMCILKPAGNIRFAATLQPLATRSSATACTVKLRRSRCSCWLMRYRSSARSITHPLKSHYLPINNWLVQLIRFNQVYTPHLLKNCGA